MKRVHLATTLKTVLPLLLVACLVATLSTPVLANSSKSKGKSDSSLKWFSGSVITIDTANQSFTIEQKDQTEVSIATDNTTKYFVVQRPNDKGNSGNDQADKQFGNVNSLQRLGKQGSFEDIAVGDNAMVHLMLNQNIAKEVFIIKPPRIQRLQGTISGIEDNSLTISKSDNTTATLNWDSSTTFVLKGSLCVQTGQTAIAVYHSDSMRAIAIYTRLP